MWQTEEYTNSFDLGVINYVIPLRTAYAQYHKLTSIGDGKNYLVDHISMGSFQGQCDQESPFFLEGKSMVSDVDFPINQSIEHDEYRLWECNNHINPIQQY